MRAANNKKTALEHSNAELFDPIRDGNLELVKRLIAAHNVNVTDGQGRNCTPLHIAAGFGHLPVVEYLLSIGANVSSADEYGVQPLHNAAAFGHTNVCRSLLKAGAGANAKDKWSFTPLHEAASRAKVDVCIVLLQHGASVSLCNSDNRTPLDLACDATVTAVLTGHYRKDDVLEAARAGSEAVLVQLLTPLNVNLHATDGRRSTALHLAAGYNRVGIVELLLSYGADVHAKDKGALVPLHNACSYGHIQVTQLILNHGADVNAVDQWLYTPLHEAASKGRAEVCSVLLAHGADPYMTNANGKTALELACSVQLRQQITSQYSAYQLLQASTQGDLDAVQKLVNKDTVNFKHYYTANTPLHVVASHCTPACADIVQLLCLSGALVNELNRDMQTPAHLATIHTNLVVLQLLAQYNAEVLNKCDGLGDSILHLAVAQPLTPARIVLVHSVLQMGVDDTIKNLRGMTAVQYCDQLHGTEATIELFSLNSSTTTSTVTSPTTTSKSRPSSAPPTRRESTSTLASMVTVADEAVEATPNDVDSTFGALHAQLLEAARNGLVDEIERIFLCVTELARGDMTARGRLVNTRDPSGRQSTALHFAAGYNRIDVLNALLDAGADVHARDKGGLVPLHNACSYGHYQIAQILVARGADVNASDLWKFTPLHEAAAKGKFDICKLLLDNGADATKKNRDGQRALDLVKESDDDVADLLRGDVSLLEAAKHGNLDKVRKLLTSENVNCRDVQGRNSKIHVEMAAVLMKYGADLTITDRWGFTALHEAAHKGRTQTCLLLLAHGADVMAANHQGLTAYDIAATDDVKCLLLDAMPSSLSQHMLSEDSLDKLHLNNEDVEHEDTDGAGMEEEESESGACSQLMDRRAHERLQRPVDMAAPANHNSPYGMSSYPPTFNPLAGLKRPRDLLHMQLDKPIADMSIVWFLKSIGLESVIDLMIKEQITMDVLVEMGHDELKQIGLDAYGVRHKLVRNIEKLTVGQPVGSTMPGFPASAPPGFSGTVLVPLNTSHPEYLAVDDEVQATIVEHKDGGASGGVYSTFVVEKVHKIFNRRLWERYIRRRDDVAEENGGQHNEKLLFHGSPFITAIVQRGFDERHAYIGGMFGAGIYFAEHSSKSNQYVYGIGGGAGCAQHRNKSCYMCKRQLILCRTTLGSQFQQLSAAKLAHAPPGHHSVIGRPTSGGLNYPEYVIYRGEQAYPEYLITYRLQAPITADDQVD